MTIPANKAAYSRISRISCIFAVLFAFTYARAQTNVPLMISYQGQVISTDGRIMTGAHTITATLYSDPHGTNSVWQGIYTSEVQNGIYSVLLGSGIYKFPDVSIMNRPLWLGIKIDDSPEMEPRALFASAPYALNVADKSITFEKLSDDVLSSMTDKGIHLKPQNVLSDPCSNNSDGGVSKNVVAGGCADTANPAGGYAGILGGLSNIVTSSYSSISGGEYNTVNNTYSFIGSGYKDTVSGDHAAIGSGQSNRAAATNSFLGAGESNYNGSLDGFLGAGNSDSLIGSTGVIVGGGSNKIVLGAGNSAIVGGSAHTISSIGGFIGGGILHTIGSSNIYSTIGGGDTNTISGSGIANYASIFGGKNNTINGTNTFSDTNAFTADYSSIGGGRFNTINGNYSVIPGGRNLTLGSRSFGFNAGSTIDVSADTNLVFFGDADLWLRNDDKTARKIKFFERSDSGTTFTSFEAQFQPNTINYILPATIGSVNEALTLTGVAGTKGTLGWGPGSNNDWHITGNSNTDPATGNFLGTNNNKAFEIHVNDSGAVNQGDKRVMRFEPNATSANITGGYQGNVITNSTGSIICGGGQTNDSNRISGGNFNTIAGGRYNRISVFAGTDTIPSFSSFIGGGDSNWVDNYTQTLQGYSVIVGGRHNYVQEVGTFVGGGYNNQASEDYGFVGGGQGNNAYNPWSVVVGGLNNNIGQGASGNVHYTFIGGGRSNATTTHDFAVVVGGQNNQASGLMSFIGGGGDTAIGNKATKSFSTVAGGNNCSSEADYSFVGAGATNKTLGAYSTISGGSTNNTTIFGTYAAIPGGDNLTAQSYTQTVIGYYNKTQGISIKPSNAHGARESIKPLDRVFIIGSGQQGFPSFRVDTFNVADTLRPRAEIRRNAFEVSNDGHSIVYGIHGIDTMRSVQYLDTLADSTVSIAVDSAKPVIKGARYVDNTCIAWGNINFTGTIVSSFGVKSVTHTAGTSVYTIALNYAYSDTDPKNPNGVVDSLVSTVLGSAITTTHVYNGRCATIDTEPISINNGHYEFKVHVWSTNCVGGEEPFMFHVFARP